MYTEEAAVQEPTTPGEQTLPASPLSLRSESDTGLKQISYTASGAPMITGFAEDTEGSLHWLIRTASSGTWNTDDDFQYAPGWDASPAGTVTDPSGKIWTAGKALDVNGKSHWIVRVRSAAGTWSTSDDFQLETDIHSSATGIAATPDGAIYVAGFASDSSGYQHWIVRKRLPGGSWSLSEDFQPQASKNAVATALAYDAGTAQLFVVGSAETGSGKSWLVRKLESGTWSTADEFQLNAGSDAIALAVAITPDFVAVTGHSQDAGNVPVWITRKRVLNSNDPFAWNTVDQFTLTAGRPALARSIASSPTGAVYVTGYAEDGSGKPISLLRGENGAGIFGDQSTFFDNVSEQPLYACTLAPDTAGQLVLAGLTVNTEATGWVDGLLGAR